ncbi:hypothetical protein HFP15_08110 [Amycolatopsis sp. K13G38]|uniref:DUF3558 domain-containing protein n=1 Tax=Amycolatopsis acididurans TaxID=2724524 RepID=A0ABX1IZS7_9PSEU|nr:hypothetical protein [Amycolatopsis acididurans]NKQ52844.1 hypothetical protein [Amycolatopsis acididurans]
MSRVIGAFALSGAALLFAGCSSTGNAAEPHTGPSPTAATLPPPSTPVATTLDKPAPVAKLAAACPLLTIDALKQLLGGTNNTQVTATEVPRKTTDVASTFACHYGNAAKTAFALNVAEYTVKSFTPADAINAIAQGAKVPTSTVPGLGEASVFYQLPDGYAVIAAAKRSHGLTRNVIFSAPAIVPKDKLAQVDGWVLDQI